jgi:hypothetical protein
MRRIWKAGLSACVAGAVAVAACGDEGPTGVGSDLLGEGVRTYEVVFDASEFLVADTTYDRIGTLDDAQFRMAAHAFGGELDARTLFALSRPNTVTYTSGGTTSTDSIAAVVGGTLTLVVDTVATSPGPIALEVLEVTEAWARAAATWTVRLDTAGVTEVWTTPGGSPGASVGSGTWTGGDTLRITMDSAAVAVWSDTLGAQLGGLVRTTTPDARIFFHSVTFQYDVRPVGADTVIQAGTIVASKIIATPEPSAAEAGVLRVGGLPAWRSLLRFQPVADMRIHCGPGQPAGCTIPLADATINTATVLLHPHPAGSRRVERPLRIEGRGVLAGPGVPVIRSPLTPPLGAPTDTLSPALFADPTTGGPVRLSVTGFIRAQFDPPTDDPPPEWLALTAVSERGQFGYAAFGGITSHQPPRLRLVVSVPDAVLMR